MAVGKHTYGPLQCSFGVKGFDDDDGDAPRETHSAGSFLVIIFEPEQMLTELLWQQLLQLYLVAGKINVLQQRTCIFYH